MRRLVAALLFLLLPGAAAADTPLVADLSKHLVAITTGFSGTEVLLFGAVEDKGDVVVVVRGPARQEVVRRKARIGGIWVNEASAEMHAPAFYRVAASRPLEQIATPEVLQRHQIGAANLNLELADVDDAAAAEFRSALLRLKERRSLYGDKVLPVSFLGNRLFRTEMSFPANVPVGTYSVEVYLLQDGQVVSAQTTPLIISKIGVGAEVYDFAHNQPAIYGMIAIVVAISAGWLAATAFKKG
jgi:uncharacterized protein (TIGR02186 family)